MQVRAIFHVEVIFTGEHDSPSIHGGDDVRIPTLIQFISVDQESQSSHFMVTTDKQGNRDPQASLILSIVKWSVIPELQARDAVSHGPTIMLNDGILKRGQTVSGMDFHVISLTSLWTKKMFRI